MENFVRFGYIAKGVVYGIVGILAFSLAVGWGGKTTDTEGTLYTIASQPFGQILLILTGVGLLGYVVLRLIEAIKDPENHGSDAKGIATRLGLAVSGLAYAGVAVNAFLLVIGSTGGGGKSKQDWTAMVMQQFLGRWLIGILGALIVGVGCWRIYQAYKIKFRKKLNLRELDYEQENLLVNISRFGVAARGVVFVIIGFFVLQAAYKANPDKVKGLNGALDTLLQQPFGRILLGLVAAGLIAYAVYLFVQARYRKLNFNLDFS